MQPGLDQQASDGFLAEHFARLEPMEAFHQHVTLAVLAHHDGGALAFFEDALGEFFHGLGVEGGAAFDRHVNVGGVEVLLFHHRHGVFSSGLP